MRKIIWDITSKCNLKCKHCYNSSVSQETEYILSNDEINEIIKKFKELNVSKICFLGGEPSLFPGLVYAVELARAYGILTSVTTNGQFFSEKLWNCIIQGGIDEIIFSLEGVSENTNDQIRGAGSFQRVGKTIKRVVEEKKKHNLATKIYCSFCVNGINQSESNSIIPYANGLGVDGVLISRIEIEGEALFNKSLVQISIKDYVDAIEKIVKSHENYLDLYLEVVCKKRLLDYLKLKYHLGNFFEDTGASVCNGFDEEFFIDSQNFIYPCRKFKEKKGATGTDGYCLICDTTTKGILTASYFHEFYNFTHDLSNYKLHSFCRNCRFFEKCKPCPYDENFVPVECIEVQKRYYQTLRTLAKQKLKFNQQILINTLDPNVVRFYNPFTEEHCEISYETFAVLKYVETFSCIEDGLNSYFNREHLEKDVSIKDFVFDYLVFSCELAKAGIILDQ